ncbi:response regulator [uncultured Fibrella sp.]|uniref:response regulator n=1 Tax=uncultured Fibrella sp. TaxID=1284596 RepID=UPI0035CAD513
MPCKILIVDDHLLFSNGLRLVLERNQDWVVCGQIPTADQVTTAVHTLSPDLVILDVNLNGTNGIDLGRKLIANFKRVKVLILTMYDQVRLLDETRRAGLHGYILKDTTPAKLTAGIQAILDGGTTFDGWVTQPVNDTGDPFGDDFARRLNLTFREVEIIRLIREGLTSEQIANRLNISFFTVKSHRKNIHSKLDLTNVADVIQFANKYGL